MKTKKPQLRCYGSLAETFEPLNPASAFRNYLKASLKSAELEPQQIDAAMSVFDRIQKSGGEEAAFQVVMAAFGTENVKEAAKTIRDEIADSIREADKKKTITKSPKARLAEYIARFNALVDKAAVKVNGKDMSKEELEKAKLPVPSWAKSSASYTATASHNGKASQLSIEVKF